MPVSDQAAKFNLSDFGIDLAEGEDAEDESELGLREKHIETAGIEQGITTVAPMKAARPARGPRRSKRGPRGTKLNFHVYEEVRLVTDEFLHECDMNLCELYEAALGALARERGMTKLEKRLADSISGKLVARDGFLVKR